MDYYTVIAVFVMKSMLQHGESAYDKVKCSIQNYMYIHISLLCKNTSIQRKKRKEIFYNINNVWVELLGL